jgi:hypothetical protein
MIGAFWRRHGVVPWIAMLAVATVGAVLHWPAAAADPEPVLLIVDGTGNVLLTCVLPTSYLLPPAMAVICERPPKVYRNGFEL